MNRHHAFDILIIGAGPAGLAAAAAIAEQGRPGLRIGIVDDNADTGGQIWRGGVARSSEARARALWSAVHTHPDFTLLAHTRICAPLGPHRLLAESPHGWITLHYGQLILATGARERLLPFPGWTLPGVTGAGGLQALVKGGYPVTGKRVVVAGSGPLLLAVAASLVEKGARVESILEQASLAQLARFATGLLRAPSKLRQAWQLRKVLRDVPYHSSSHVVRAHGEDRLQGISWTSGGRKRELDCDYLACGFGLIPNTELACALGCAASQNGVRVDTFQATSVAGIYCAGESTGIGGVDLALVEGRIAGLAACGQIAAAHALSPERMQWRRFASLLEHSFSLRDELRGLCEADTIVCRCEDARHGELAAHASWRSAKLHTRCGMGACQGRVCGGATGFLYGWVPDAPRTPIVPTRIAALAQQAQSRELSAVSATHGTPSA